MHAEVGHTDNESAQHFDSEKLSQFVIVLRVGFEPLLFGSRVDALPIEPPHHPLTSCVRDKDGGQNPRRREGRGRGSL